MILQTLFSYRQWYLNTIRTIRLLIVAKHYITIHLNNILIVNITIIIIIIIIYDTYMYMRCI